MFYIQYVSLCYRLFNDIKHVTVTQTETIQTDDKFENLKCIFLTRISRLICHEYA